jgi:hypothetical protein
VSHSTTGDNRPYERAEEIVLFQYFVEHGLPLPVSDFFHSLLFYYGVQLHHLNPNSILHISIFVHFYEAFLGIEPQFNLFCYLFNLKPQPNESSMYEVNGVGLKLRLGMEKSTSPTNSPLVYLGGGSCGSTLETIIPRFPKGPPGHSGSVMSGLWHAKT